MAVTDSPLPLGLLSLPAEVRNAIYSLLLVRAITPTPSFPTQPFGDSLPGWPRSQYMGLLPPTFPKANRHLYPLDQYNDVSMSKVLSLVYPTILLSCKQIYIEAAPILYANNAFEFSGSDKASAWINSLRSEHAELVRDITIWLPDRKDALRKLKRVMKTANGLRRLHLRTERIQIRHAEGFLESFPSTAVQWVEEHEHLKLAMSQDKQEYHPGTSTTRRYRWGFEDYKWGGMLWLGAVCVTFVASLEDAEEEDGECFDVDEWSQALDLADGERLGMWTYIMGRP